MGSFITNLWESVFTPGTTPTLLIATNVTFASLQVLLFGLLIATYSVHFAVLSVLCGGLWYSINWFAMELQAAQRAEDEAERLRKRKASSAEEKRGEVGDADDEGDDTEVEGAGGIKGLGGSTASLCGEGELVGSAGGFAGERVAQPAAQDSVMGTTASGVQADMKETRQRLTTKADLSSSEFSTDSEWEKVS